MRRRKKEYKFNGLELFDENDNIVAYSGMPVQGLSTENRENRIRA